MKKLTRSYTDRIIAGVCGGYAEYFSVDSTIIRILFVASLLCGGAGLLVYLASWILMSQN